MSVGGRSRHGLSRLAASCTLAALVSACAGDPPQTSTPASRADEATPAPAVGPSVASATAKSALPGWGNALPDAPTPRWLSDDPLDVRPPVASPLGSDGRYGIVLERARTKGERVRRTAEVTTARGEMLAVGPRTIRMTSENHAIRLVADEEVLAVDPSGTLRSVKLTIVTFVEKGTNGEQALLAPGTEVSLVHPNADPLRSDYDELRVTSSRGAPSEAARRALLVAIPFEASGDDLDYGSDSRREHGDEWTPRRVGRLEGELRDAGLHVGRSGVRGWTRLADVQEGRGGLTLVIAAGTRATIERVDDPPGSRVERASADTDMHWIVPAAGRLVPSSRLAARSIDLVLRVPHGKEIATLTRWEKTVHTTSFDPAPVLEDRRR